ncbi:MAG: hypothetical protein JXA41_02570 [Deltaproteobacteria bacterium]|nr:hypothetical protein [Deltaproteobacteria bacterium]
MTPSTAVYVDQSSDAAEKMDGPVENLNRQVRLLSDVIGSNASGVLFFKD